MVLYQEQVIQVASAMAGFTPAQADMLRRAMTHNASKKDMESMQSDFAAGAVEKGIRADIAARVFNKLTGFAHYGFNKAHAAAFARISYESAYLKAHYPAHYLASVMNCEPMGFYPPGSSSTKPGGSELKYCRPTSTRAALHSAPGAAPSESGSCRQLRSAGAPYEK